MRRTTSIELWHPTRLNEVRNYHRPTRKAPGLEDNKKINEVGGKVQQLIGFLVQQPADGISNDFDCKAADPDCAEYFDNMIAEALSSHFNVPTEASDIASLNTVQDIVNRINNA